jgi:L-ascorbate metabolism protein UlaG (beta-lactamase superfamily)
MIRHDGLTVEWLGYATTRIETPDGYVVYLDPGRHNALEAIDYEATDGDLVCVTHNHHYDPEGIRRVAKPNATVVVYEGVNPLEITGREAGAVEDLDYHTVRIGETDRARFDDVVVETLPAYNPPESDHTDEHGEPMHPKGFGVGYRLELAGTSLFWPGDSDVVPEFEGIECSLFLPPIGGAFTMDRHQAADLAERLDPDLVLPIHYNTFDALAADEEAFVVDVAKRSIPVVLDDADVPFWTGN